MAATPVPRAPSSFAVVGGGIIGLAVARELGMRAPGAAVTVFENGGLRPEAPHPIRAVRQARRRPRRHRARVRGIHARAVANGVPVVSLIGPERIRELEPEAVGMEALRSPEPAIIDYPDVAGQLAAGAWAAR